jgi:hypothetical protein
MHDEGMMNVTYLQERAARCRRLAKQASSHGIAIELEKLAGDYDKDVARTEAFIPGRWRLSFY